jgi:opacity protein-like surface antigen
MKRLLLVVVFLAVFSSAAWAEEITKEQAIAAYWQERIARLQAELQIAQGEFQKAIAEWEKKEAREKKEEADLRRD